VSSSFLIRIRSFAVVGAVAGALLAGPGGCAGEIDPSLIPKSGGGGSGSPLGQAGSGGGASVCDAPKMVFSASCSPVGCHSANSSGGAGLDLASAGVVARLLGQGPSTNTAAAAACEGAGKPYLAAGSNPATGLLMDKVDPAKVTCGTSMALLGQLDAAEVACLTAWATAVTTGVITP
jgi:hypothetical protein